ncbi:MAG TPA: hypothetical protein VGP82_25800 [Ktedonobacterales bacterium]|jgi:glucose dehydrogenase|nr:hypothetical protein [Ktedonobacterales bacterium]
MGASSGKSRCSFQTTPDTRNVTLVTDGETVLPTNQAVGLYALDAATGARRWQGDGVVDANTAAQRAVGDGVAVALAPKTTWRIWSSTRRTTGSSSGAGRISSQTLFSSVGVNHSAVYLSPLDATYPENPSAHRL